MKTDVSDVLTSSQLALNGGTPVFDGEWGAGDFHFPDELELLKEVLAGPALPLARGNYVMAFREAIAVLYQRDHIVTTSSGTSAIHVALAALGVEAGDEVIVTPLTDYGSIIGILQLNAIPVFCDVIATGLQLDIQQLDQVVSDHTRVIMPIHNGGYPVDMPALINYAAPKGIAILEDCAQSHLTKIGDTYCGCFGDAGAFSTNESKHMKTGEGGFILFKEKNRFKYAELFADKCYKRFPDAPDSPAFPALNVRMSDINAAIGIQQLKRLPDWIASRNKRGKEIETILSKYPLIPQWVPQNTTCSYWWFACYLDSEGYPGSTSEFQRALNAEGIPCWTGIQRYLPDWELFRKLDQQPNGFPNYRPGRLEPGRYPQDGFPHARWHECNMLAIAVNQHLTSREITSLDEALAKIFGSI
jgi:perosamine synthetase